MSALSTTSPAGVTTSTPAASSARPVIPIENLYVLLAYGMTNIRPAEEILHSGDSFPHAHDILARMLSDVTTKLITRGLRRDYVTHREELPGVRGRIDIGSSLRAQSQLRGRLVCEFDEYTPDIACNRMVKLALTLLLHRGQASYASRATLRRLLGHLESITCPTVRQARAYDFTTTRLNPLEEQAIALAGLVIHDLLPHDDDGTTPLQQWVDEATLAALFERFVRNYFRIHHPHLNSRSHHIPWCEQPTGTPHSATTLPLMRTDITLTAPTGRTLIIDTKFYTHTMGSFHGGAQKMRSAHLYQIQSYVLHHAAQSPHEVMGMLLYARTTAEKQPDFDAHLLGHRVLVRTIDLACPHQDIFRQLDNIAGLLAPAAQP